MSTSLLATKLYRPPPQPNSVLRPRLLTQLNDGLRRNLTLIAAPAGFGKTTLLSQWLPSLERRTQTVEQAGNDQSNPALRSAWLTLDEGDREPARFLAYLVAALQSVVPQLGAGLMASLLAPQPPPTDVAMTDLINALAALAQPIVLVLDDYHLVNSPPVDAALSLLLAHQPPQLHLVIATREDPQLPLARLRARGALSELRAVDLRFTPLEASALFTKTEGLRLSAEDVAALERCTEGWAAGLRLAALSLRGHQDSAGFVRSFSGSHRFVRDYLLEEVLRQQPVLIQQFLLRTAILDRLCGPLCDAVLEAPPGVGQATLYAIERANLFLVPLDDERRWYRYHHLFGELLRQRLPQDAGLSKDDLAGLHLRASDWYEAQGLMLEALDHAAAAADPARVAALAECSWAQLDSGFQSAAWCRWVRQLPEAVLLTRPVLCMQYASALSNAGDLEGSTARLRDAERWLAPEGQAEEPVVLLQAQFAALPMQIAILRAYNAHAAGDFAAAAQHAACALAQPNDAQPLLRAQAMSLLSFSHLAEGDITAAERAINVWIAYTREAGQLAFTLASSFYLVEMRLAQGQLREAARLYRQLLELVPPDDEGASRAVPHLHLGLALVAHEQGDGPTAARHLQASKEAGERVALIDWPFRWHLLQARVKASTGDWEAALDLLDEAGRRYVPNPVPDLRPIAALKARVRLRQGNLAAASAWAAEVGLKPADELGYLREFEQLTLVRLLLARARQQQDHDELPAVFPLLVRLLSAAEATGRVESVIEILLLQAMAHEVCSEPSQARVPLERALALAEPEGYVRLFVDEGPPLARLLERMRDTGGLMQAYVHTLLNAFGKQATLHPASHLPPPSGESLSEREREVLRLIAEGLSNQELAVRLHLSPQTVKVHTRNIYSKLGVSSRTQAVARGRALGMLELP
ncbi:LuxR C-terminal-related transcriptional regulator [Candidatus Chloroploca asiatica]|uniref:HTH luxR-type domain-containing protein n=1 Tax=Candidatus Chloroploca asiatica TaxID=1506545 RepID=A0A2H3KI17_9CHLR|nr:LuxR C-terminal-related transcriptional regulator [Candidatus Chloroploca asiatica]PDV97455.1 hypothetical protein A9Q02_18340 [Candidatus Chloroploca asiatica]